MAKPYDGVKVYHDYRELLQNKDIDAVLISTPDHTHAMIAIAATKAGKHIYMQKPASLNDRRRQTCKRRGANRVISNSRSAASNVRLNSFVMQQNWYATEELVN
jgi:ActR/RegA family two-component response regulator